MIMPSDDKELSELRNKIIGLGERSQKKSYYPELKKRFSELEKFKVLLDSSNDFIFLTAMPEGIISDINGIVCEVLKYKRREVVGSEIKSFFSKEAWDYIEAFTKTFSGTPTRNSFNANIKRKDGYEFPVEITFSLAVFKEQNYVIIVARDISERIKTEEALKNSELNMRTVFNSSRDAIIIHDENGNILEVNDPMIKLYEIDRLSFQKYTIKDLSAGEDFSLDDPPKFIQLALTGEDQLFTWQAIKPGTKQEFLAEVFLRKIIWYGKKMILANVRDITEKKRTEFIINNQMKDLEAKNTEMERFTYTVSHDLRSPLITIKGFAGAVLEDLSIERYDRIKPDIKRIENAAERMQALLEDLLELSRIGRIVNPPIEFSMKKLGYEVKELLTGIIEKKEIELRINDLMPKAFGDIQRIREVIQNLIENSVKFMDKESEKIIEFGFKNEGDEVIYFIRDNGPGINEKYHDKIFGLFNKLNVGSEGTGIGLAIVKRIIELHGGKIWVESARNAGATFFFTLKHKPDSI